MLEGGLAGDSYESAPCSLRDGREGGTRIFWLRAFWLSERKYSGRSMRKGRGGLLQVLFIEGGGRVRPRG